MASGVDIFIDLFDESSIASALRRTGNLDQSIDKAITDAKEELSWRIRDRLLQELGNLGLADSNLASNINIYDYGDGLWVTVNSEYAMFVEFGTGIRGEENPHPNPAWRGIDWEYDTNGHGENGWWYPTTSSDPNPVKKYDSKKNCWFGFTRGLPARPFMYRTWRYTRNITTKVINKHLRRIEV